MAWWWDGFKWNEKRDPGEAPQEVPGEKETVKPRPGDLVKFSRESKTNPPFVIPEKTDPVGIVLEVYDATTTGPEDSRALFTLAKVLWSDPKWNGRDGLSDEALTDLVVIQPGDDS